MRPTRDATWLAVAAEVARRSTCLRRAVGCVLTNERGHVLATGYNGRAAGQPHCNEPDQLSCARCDQSLVHQLSGGASNLCLGWCLGCGFLNGPDDAAYPNACTGARSPSGVNLDGCEAIHAEQNALLQCRDVYAIHTCYVTVSPCIACVKLLLNTGCRRIAFAEPYVEPHHSQALRLWRESRGILGRTVPGQTWEHATKRAPPV